MELSGFRVRWAIVLASIILSSVSPFDAVAQDQCLTAPVALPQLAGPPVWLDPAPSTATWRAELSDPRWAGAPLLNLCNNPDLSTCPIGNPDVQVRALLNGTDLYVAFQNLSDDTVEGGDDFVFLGIGDPTAGAKMVKVLLHYSGLPISPAPSVADTTPPKENSAFSIQYSQASNASNGSSWATLSTGFPPAVLPATESWLKDVASWTGSPGVAWGVTMRIDLSQFGYTDPISSNIPLFFGSRYNTSAETVVLPTTSDTVGGDESIVPGDKATWTLFSAPASGCAGGIRLSYMNIGVVNSSGDLSSSVKVCTDPADCPGGLTHTFRALPQQVPDGTVVRARMRLANFGSTILDWENADWDEIPGAGNPLVDISAATGWSFSPGASGSSTIDHVCNIQGGDLSCPTLSNAPGQPDQCLLVELGPPPGTNLKFESKAVYRNLWFANLSEIQKQATVSTKGLKKSAGLSGERDLYFYVQTKNMPTHSVEKMVLPQRAMGLVRKYAENIPARPRYQDPKGVQNPANQSDKKAESISIVRMADASVVSGKVPARHNPLSYPTLSEDQAMGLAWPTYIVRVYYDTGKVTDSGGEQHKTLAPMTPFGFYLNHEGEFYGFTHELTGLGFDLEEIGPNWYRTKVAHEGSVKLVTTIRAEEKPAPACSCKCKNCAEPGHGHEHTHGKADLPKTTCYCSAPGTTHSGSGWLLLLAAGAFVAMAQVRRRRSS